MTIAAAKAFIVGAVEGITPTAKARGLAAFKHDPAGEPQRPCGRSRDFMLRTLSGEAHMPSTASFQRRTATMALMVDYVDDVASDALDTAIVQDADAIIARLSTGDWSGSTSSIVAISAEATGLLPYTIEDLADGAARRLTVTLSVTYDT